MSSRKLKIEVYYSKGNERNWDLLADSSAYLTELQLIPDKGDGLTISGKDGQSIGLEKGSFHHIQTVQRKWFNFRTADVAVLVDYESW